MLFNEALIVIFLSSRRFLSYSSEIFPCFPPGCAKVSTRAAFNLLQIASVETVSSESDYKST